MSNTTEKLATDEYINKMYDSQLNSQKEQLTQNYNQAVSDLDATKEQNAQNLQKNLNTTAVESQRAQKNYNEVQNAYGLSSGAMAQARLAQDNQLQADLTTLRAAQQTADAGIERERALLSQQYSSAIAQAQSDNDLARAEALYAEAKDAEAQLLAKQEAAAQLMAGVGDYSLIGQLYGLTDEQIAKLTPKSGGNPQPQFTAEELATQALVENVVDNFMTGSGRGNYASAVQDALNQQMPAYKDYGMEYLQELVRNGYLKTPAGPEKK